jgi:hypothetical protein
VPHDLSVSWCVTWLDLRPGCVIAILPCLLLRAGERPAAASIVDDLLAYADSDDTGIIFYERLIKKVGVRRSSMFTMVKRAMRRV